MVNGNVVMYTVSNALDNAKEFLIAQDMITSIRNRNSLPRGSQKSQESYSPEALHRPQTLGSEGIQV